MVAVAWVNELAEGQFKQVEVNGQAFIIAEAHGLIYALADQCGHEDYPLSYGCIHGDTIKCSLHGSRFDLLTGFPLDEPAELPVPVYRVVVGFDRVWIDPREPVDPEEYYHEVKGY
ncbi:Rieske 2Fe-2S domain-containing protein [Thiospirillum jenense]|uniref:Rieske 2Fe-2S domain-containing protein n=2 Tax=Thiospirillum jenense TaxID=1653858 RepID=A0A839HJI2_9GAMM|nr:Rieske 2Fe-2S domain-containing protein [Thiospirillum jenense]MBB1126968.1 Rieske 2Fe-2S domain-containing protein [Thiospirillum jenense]